MLCTCLIKTDRYICYIKIKISVTLQNTLLIESKIFFFFNYYFLRLSVLARVAGQKVLKWNGSSKLGPRFQLIADPVAGNLIYVFFYIFSGMTYNLNERNWFHVCKSFKAFMYMPITLPVFFFFFFYNKHYTYL